jgi:hypothetical protein
MMTLNDLTLDGRLLWQPLVDILPSMAFVRVDVQSSVRLVPQMFVLAG